MTTINDAQWGSDDEEDTNFELSNDSKVKRSKEEATSDCTSSPHESSEEEEEEDDDEHEHSEGLHLSAAASSRPPKKRRKQSGKKKQKQQAAAEPSMSKEDVDDLWKSFNQTEAVPISSDPRPTKKIKIKKAFKFAGDVHEDEVEVDEDSLDAKAWLEQLGKPAPPPEAQPAASFSALPTISAPSTSSEVPVSTPTEPLPTSLSTAASTLSSQPKPGPKPGPKRPRTNLASLSASLNAKPTKLTTLEKSKMDWDKYVSTEGIKDDLNQSRKNGYMERQDFLQRTQERSDQKFSELKKA